MAGTPLFSTILLAVLAIPQLSPEASQAPDRMDIYIKDLPDAQRGRLIEKLRLCRHCLWRVPEIPASQARGWSPCELACRQC